MVLPSVVTNPRLGCVEPSPSGVPTLGGGAASNSVRVTNFPPTAYRVPVGCSAGSMSVLRSAGILHVQGLVYAFYCPRSTGWTPKRGHRCAVTAWLQTHDWPPGGSPSPEASRKSRTRRTRLPHDRFYPSPRIAARRPGAQTTGATILQPWARDYGRFDSSWRGLASHSRTARRGRDANEDIAASARSRRQTGQLRRPAPLRRPR
jgi:hypothetical protein